VKFAFWNVKGKLLVPLLRELVERHGIELLVLAEFLDPENQLLHALNSSGRSFFKLLNIGCDRITIYSNFEPGHFSPRREAGTYTIREFAKPGYLSAIFGFVHLPSKAHMKDDEQLQEVMYFMQDVRAVEAECQNTNTVLAGDFNMNPFDPGMIAAAGVHSVSCLATASRGPRTIRERKHDFFYNPTWNLLGDWDGPAGTFFYPPPSYDSLYWHMLDQVVLRPSLAKLFDPKSLRILTSIGSDSLMSNLGRPSVSDHLPIIFSIALEAPVASKEVRREESMAQ